MRMSYLRLGCPRHGAFQFGRLELIPIGWNHPIDKNALQINTLKHVLIGKVSRLFRDML